MRHSIPGPGEALQLPGCRDGGLDRLFAPRPTGYLGGDIGLSVPLGVGRTLWIFGDTLLGEMSGSRRNVTAMPRNSAALVDHDGGRVEWLFDGERDFFRLPESGKERWFWPGTAFLHEDLLYVLGYEVCPGPGPWESLSFSITGTWLLRVSGASRAPQTWECNAVPFPSPVEGGAFCSANLVQGQYVYLLGFLRNGEQEWNCSAAVMARLPVAALNSPAPAGLLETLGEDEGMPTWVRRGTDVRVLYRPGVTECSLYHDAPRERYLATTYDAREGLLRVSTSPHLVGPWSDPLPVYRVPEFQGADRHIAYTFRMHPHLARAPEEMVLTYVVNTRSLATLLDEPNLYYPRFVRADLRLI